MAVIKKTIPNEPGWDAHVYAGIIPEMLGDALLECHKAITIQQKTHAYEMLFVVVKKIFDFMVDTPLIQLENVIYRESISDFDIALQFKITVKQDISMSSVLYRTSSYDTYKFWNHADGNNAKSCLLDIVSVILIMLQRYVSNNIYSKDKTLFVDAVLKECAPDDHFSS